ncbi:MAG: hypothetical protein ABJH06_07360, partial [Paraglaciecola sp.]
MKKHVLLTACIAAILSLNACSVKESYLDSSASSNDIVIPAGFKKITSVVKSADELVIPFNKYE